MSNPFFPNIPQVPTFSPSPLPHETLASIQHSLRNIEHFMPNTSSFLDTTAYSHLFQNIHPSWSNIPHYSQTDLSNAFNIAQKAGQFINGIPEYVKNIDSIYNNIKFNNLYNDYNIDFSIIKNTESSILSAIESYKNISPSIDNISSLTQYPSNFLPNLSEELYQTLKLIYDLPSKKTKIKQTKPQLHLSNKDKILDVLKKVDPKLQTPYLGILHTLKGDNPDKTRHFLSSLRELLTHFLHTLSPDQLVHEWISRQPSSKGLLDRGKITRSARMQYICRNADLDAFQTSAKANKAAFIDVIEILNKMHKIDIFYENDRLESILETTNNLILFYYEIEEKFNKQS